MSTLTHLLLKDPQVLKDLGCSHSDHLLNDPVQPSCGHRLCKSCADQIIQRNPISPRCPKEDCNEKFSLLNNGKHVSYMRGNDTSLIVLGTLVYIYTVLKIVPEPVAWPCIMFAWGKFKLMYLCIVCITCYK